MLNHLFLTSNGIVHNSGFLIISSSETVNIESGLKSDMTLAIPLSFSTCKVFNELSYHSSNWSDFKTGLPGPTYNIFGKNLYVAPSKQPTVDKNDCCKMRSVWTKTRSPGQLD